MKRAVILTGCICVFLNVGFAQTTDTTAIKEKPEKYWWRPGLLKNLHVAFGGFLPISNTNVQVSATGPNHSIGTEINFEDDLGFSRSGGTFMADIQYRLSRRSRFDLSFYRLNRSASHTLTKDIAFEVIPLR